jgi:hypothetical protein
MRSGALALGSTLLLAACGGGDGGGGNPLPPPGPPLVKVSAATPFGLACNSFGGSSTLYLNAEVEPHIAVDPANPARLLAAWQQDRFSDGGARGLVTARSSDGGATWARTRLPASLCGGGTFANGGAYDRASDPWVAFGADGRAYAIALAIDQSAASGDNAVLVFRSFDGGATWGPATTLIFDDVTSFNDKEAMAADPGDPDYAYAAWDRLTSDRRGPAMFARTIDGGATWEAARVVYDPGVDEQTLNNIPVVAPDGTVHLQFTRILANGAALLYVMRSTDHGASFTAPLQVDTMQPVGARDPADGTPIRDGAGLASIAAGPSGELVVAWADARTSGGARDAILFRRSTDGGATWSPAVAVNQVASTQAFTPTIAVRADGRIGITYFDFRDDVAGDGLLTTSKWLVTSSDGVDWTETRIAQPFDMHLAPVARGYFLGDYMGLVTSGTSFVPLFTQTNNRGTDDRTDVFTLPVGVLAGAATVEMAYSAKPIAPGASATLAPAASRAALLRALAARVPEGSPWQARYEAAARAAERTD